MPVIFHEVWALRFPFNFNKVPCESKSVRANDGKIRSQSTGAGSHALFALKPGFTLPIDDLLSVNSVMQMIMGVSLLSTDSSSGSCSRDTSEILVFTCNICSLRPINPVEACCKHLFCWPCLLRLNQGQEMRCPVCNTMLSSSITVAPVATFSESLMHFLPQAHLQVKGDEEEMDRVSTNMTTTFVRGPAQAKKKNVLILYMGNKMIRTQTEKLQKRVRRARRLLRKARVGVVNSQHLEEE